MPLCPAPLFPTLRSDGGHAAFVKGLRGNETLRVLCFSDSTLESTDAGKMLRPCHYLCPISGVSFSLLLLPSSSMHLFCQHPMPISITAASQKSVFTHRALARPARLACPARPQRSLASSSPRARASSACATLRSSSRGAARSSRRWLCTPLPLRRFPRGIRASR